MDPHNVPGTTARVSGLRANSLAAVVMLLTEYALGTWVNLYAQLPASDHGKAPLAAFGRAVADGPVVLAIHALLGTVLLITGITAVVRAVIAGRPAWIALGTVAFLAIAVAWFSGTRFVGDASSSASFSMALATAIAVLAYVTILFTAASASTPGSAPPPPSERGGSGR